MKPETHNIKREDKKNRKIGFFRRSEKVSSFKFHVSNQRGFSLIEMLVYVAILTLSLVFITTALVRVSTSYRVLKDAKNISHAAADILSRMVYEIRQSDSIDGSESTFGSSPGVLVLGQSGVAKEFYVSGGALRLTDAGVDQGSLTPAGATVTGFTVYQLQNSVSKAVAITLTLASKAGTATTTKTFRTTAVLRDVY